MADRFEARRRSNAEHLAALIVAACVCLSPPAAFGADAFAVMRDWGRFETFCHLIEGAGLAERVRSADPITVFAPTDAAFARLPAGALSTLERQENRKELRELLLYHVVPERLRILDLRREAPRTTLHGKTITSLLMSGTMMVNDAFIDVEDIEAGNGIVHAIDKVLVPPP